MLRIHLVEAQNLIAKDNFMGGMVKGKSDPYVKIRVAGITFRSHTIRENLNPYWNESFVFIIDEMDMKRVTLDITVSSELSTYPITPRKIFSQFLTCF